MTNILSSEKPINTKVDLCTCSGECSVGELAKETAHDFNNILQIIQTNIELLRLQKNDEGSPVELLSRINNAVERGGVITSKLLEISKHHSMEPEITSKQGESQAMVPGLTSQNITTTNAIKRVLIVEDDDEVRRSTVLLMECLGIALEEATSADTALDILIDDQNFDIIFSDVFMPGSISGFGLADTCRIQYPEIRVLLASGYPEEELEKLGKGKGDYNLLHKPFSIAELENAFDEINKP